MWTGCLLWGLAAGVMTAAAACSGSTTPVPTITNTDTPVPTPTDTPVPTATRAPLVTDPPDTLVPDQAQVVRVDEVEFPVDLALTPEERAQGLSGRASLNAGTGMLFVYDEANRYVFWMKEMEFPLDMVWISAECQVVDISENVPFPDPNTPLVDLPRYSPDTPARYVLEINGGESAALGLAPGDPVKFVGALAGEYGC